MIGKKRAHVLKPNEGSETPSNLILFDCETRAEREGNSLHHYLRLGWAVYWQRREDRRRDTEEWFFFRTPGEFWEWFRGKVRSRTKLYVSAHNIDFDWGAVGGYHILPSWGYELVKGWERQRAFYRLYRMKGSSVCLIDSMNLWPMSLEGLGASLGLPKLKIDFGKADDEELSEYCRRDVEILLRAWQWWLQTIKEDDLGCFKPTLAGQAFSAYRHRFMSEPIYIHANERVIELERAAYHGGRVECFYIGPLEGRRIYVLDVNSMYPAVMKHHAMPRALATYYKHCNRDYLPKLLMRYGAIAHVLIQTDEPAYCVEREGRLIFPVGRFWAYLTTPELMYAVEHGHVKDVQEAALYHMGATFGGYVDHMYGQRMRARQEGRPDRELVYKLLLNSLYGKFGQKLDVWEPVGKCDPQEEGVFTAYEEASGKIRHYRLHEGIIEVHGGEIEGYESFVAIPAHCTGYARMLLWDCMKQAGLEHVYYVDTDSLWVDEEGFERLRTVVDPNTLGKLKLEKVVTSAVLRGPKDYICGGEEKIKGVRKDAVQIAPNQYEQDMWLGYKLRLRRNLLTVPTVDRVTKTLQRTYDKGCVSEDGRVRPIALEE